MLATNLFGDGCVVVVMMLGFFCLFSGDWVLRLRPGERVTERLFEREGGSGRGNSEMGVAVVRWSGEEGSDGGGLIKAGVTERVLRIGDREERGAGGAIGRRWDCRCPARLIAVLYVDVSCGEYARVHCYCGSGPRLCGWLCL